MALEIEIITLKDSDQVVDRRKAPGQFSTKTEADQAAAKLAKSYPTRGYDKEHGYWWARDDAGRHRFIVREAGAANILDNPDVLSDSDVLKK